ncbi:hypothetical protein [Blastococcus sp. SYSU DS1024]
MRGLAHRGQANLVPITHGCAFVPRDERARGEAALFLGTAPFRHGAEAHREIGDLLATFTRHDPDGTVAG